MKKAVWLLALVWGVLVLTGCGGGGGGGDDDAGVDAGQDAGGDLGQDAGEDAGEDGGPDTDTVTDTDTTDGGQDGGGDEVQGDGPVFRGILFGYPMATDQVSLHWFEAVDDVTPAADIVYYIYQGNTAEELAGIHGTGQPVGTVTGGTSFVVGNLATDQTYYFLAIAEDADGNASTEENVVAVTTLDQDMVVDAAPIDMADLDVTVAEEGLNQFAVTGTDASGLQVGDIIIIPYSLGRWLRRITAIESIAGGVRLTTENAAMADFIQSGTIRMSSHMIEMPDSGDYEIVTRLGPGREQMVRRYVDPEGNFAVEERILGTPNRGVKKTETSTELEQGVTMDWTLGFEPSFELEAKWDDGIVIDSPTQFKATARGAIVFDATVGYSLAAGAEYKTRKELWSYTKTLNYVVAGVPVTQDLTLGFYAELELSAEANFELSSAVHAEKWVQVELEWIDGRGWTFTKEDGFEREITFTADGQVVAKGTLRLACELSTRFYKAARAKIHIVPTVEAEIEADLNPDPPFPPHFTKFDVIFFVDAYVSADVTIFGKELAKWESEHYKLIEIPIYSLPQAQMRPKDKTIDTCFKKMIYLGATDGYNNPVDYANIQWTIDPPGLPLIPQGSNLIAEFDPQVAGTYTIMAAAKGSGFLGDAGKVYAATTFTVEEPVGQCDQEPPLGVGDLFGCATPNPPHLGLHAFPTMSESMIAPGDPVDLILPAWCEDINFCFVAVSMLREGGGEMVFWEPYPQWPPSSCPPCANDGAVTLALDPPADVNPGVWAPTIFIMGNPPDNTQSAYFNPRESTDPNSAFFSSYEVTLVNQPDGCTGFSGVPIPKVNIVAIDPYDDGNEDPSVADRLDINSGKRVHSRFDENNDRDYFRVSSFADQVYDSDLPPADPACPFTVELSGAYVYACLYESEEDAQNDVRRLSCSDDGTVGHWSGQNGQGGEYIVMAQGSGSEANPTGYDVSAASDCDGAWINQLLSLLDVPQVSVTQVQRSGTVDVTLYFTDNVGTARMRLAGPTSGSASNWVQVDNLEGLGTVTATLDIFSYAMYQPFWLQVELRYTNSTNGTMYDRDDEFSTDNYHAWAKSEDGSFDVHLDSGIPVIWVEVVP